MLVERQQISRREQQINPAEDGSVGGKAGDQVEEDPTQVHGQLLRNRAFFQCQAVQPNK